MRHYYKTHGKHCYLRLLQTKCLKCGISVLYWDCSHGSKVNFNYSPYGKLERQFCRYTMDKLKLKTNFPFIFKGLKELLEKELPSFSACGK